MPRLRRTAVDRVLAALPLTLFVVAWVIAMTLGRDLPELAKAVGGCIIGLGVMMLEAPELARDRRDAKAALVQLKDRLAASLAVQRDRLAALLARQRHRFRRWARSRAGQYVVDFAAPIFARPADFRDRMAHQFYGNMSAVPLRPLIAAGLFASSMGVFFASIAPDMAARSETDVRTAVELSFKFISYQGWLALGFMFFLIHAIALMRCTWHFIIRHLTNWMRRDGERSNSAPWRFFLVNTSGWALWFSAWTLLIAVALPIPRELGGREDPPSFDPTWLEDHPAVVLVIMLGVVGFALAFIHGIAWSGKAILLDIYKTAQVAGWVRGITFVMLLLVFGGYLWWMIARIFAAHPP